MSKYTQLQFIQRLGLKVPKFQAISSAAFRQKSYSAEGLIFPVAVRSSYALEDGQEKSHAGEFATVLDIEPAALENAIEQVFSSYPEEVDQLVVVQEMVHAEYSGVLFAHRGGVWKIEMAAGAGAQVVGGQTEVQTILLPHFSAADLRWAPFWLPWQPAGIEKKATRKALMKLAIGTEKLLEQDQEARHGLDIEFSIVGGQLYFLQARPITTEKEKEVVLTSANHKEILPPKPSPFMTSIITSAGADLFAFYKDLDPSLPDYDFLVEAEGMPWINLTALMDTMVHWGLPTRLVARSVGATDFYKVGFRPWRVLRKVKVFLKLRKKQKRIALKVKNWVNKQRNKLRIHRLERVLMWQTDASLAAESLIKDFRQFYIELVTQMQLLTGAMSGPIALFNRLGIMSKMAKLLVKNSASTDYFHAFSELSDGRMSRERFLRNYGHRGFYESDIGQPRFQEYSDQEWLSLLHNNAKKDVPTTSKISSPGATPFYLQGLIALIHSREWIRHMSMQFFWFFRNEMMTEVEKKMGEGCNPWDYRPEDLLSILNGQKWMEETGSYPEPSGWDMDTFLFNGYGRRLPIEPQADQADYGIGIYPGVVRGQVWRVQTAKMAEVAAPPYEKVILVADALDPGWIPYFTKVDGVVSYVGGLLSHASIILREAGIPSITQFPADQEFPDGAWIEMNGKTGEVKLLASAAFPGK